MQYIKVSKDVAEWLGLKYSRPVLPDGNYTIWDRDLLRLGSSDDLEEIVASLGGKVMSASELRAEQDGAEPCELSEISQPQCVAFMAQKKAREDNEKGGDE